MDSVRYTWTDGVRCNVSAGLGLIAGGLGIVPMMSMLRTLAARGDQRPITLFYAYRNLENLTFREELNALTTQLNLKCVIVLNEPPTDWSGERGLLTQPQQTSCWSGQAMLGLSQAE